MAQIFVSEQNVARLDVQNSAHVQEKKKKKKQNKIKMEYSTSPSFFTWGNSLAVQ